MDLGQALSAKKQVPARRPKGLYKSQARSRITNGRDLLPHVDGRIGWVRRFRDCLALHLSDLPDASYSEQVIARRCACLVVALEQMETEFAQAGHATPEQLREYGRGTNTLRRALESLGLTRRARDVTPTLQQLIEGCTTTPIDEAAE